MVMGTSFNKFPIVFETRFTSAGVCRFYSYFELGFQSWKKSINWSILAAPSSIRVASVPIDVYEIFDCDDNDEPTDPPAMVSRRSAQDMIQLCNEIDES